MNLLDTNVVSELRKAKSDKGDVNVVKWASSVVVGDLYISAITILELEKGILLIDREDKSQGEILRRWFNEHAVPTFNGRVLPFDATAALRHVQLYQPDPAGGRDTIIAATVLVHGTTVMTRNIQNFVGTGVSLINPWKN
jgi:hypothetical protein